VAVAVVVLLLLLAVVVVVVTSDFHTVFHYAFRSVGNRRHRTKLRIVLSSRKYCGFHNGESSDFAC
jgi:type II secretory pathway component PulK